MASLADIPQNLMDKNKAIAFFDWMATYKLPPHSQRELCQNWCYHAGADPKVTFAILETRLVTVARAQ
jgi:hypothetical protein